MNRLCAQSECSANAWLRYALIGLLLLTFANLFVHAIGYEMGLRQPSPYVTGVEGPVDRYADWLKVSFSYPPYRQAIRPETVSGWPHDLQQYFTYPVYGGVEGLNGHITHFHLTPFMTVFYLASAKLLAITQNIWLDLGLFYLLYLSTAAWALWIGVPPEKRSRALQAAVAVFVTLSYPALFVFFRGNMGAGWTSLLITAFLLAVFLRKAASFPVLLSLAIAANCRPNALIFALALPLAFGIRRSLKPLFIVGALGAGILGGSFALDHWIYPAYTLPHILRGLELYRKGWVVGMDGDGGNSSLLAMLKNYNSLVQDFNRAWVLAAIVLLLILGLYLLRRFPQGRNWSLLMLLPLVYFLAAAFSEVPPGAFPFYYGGCGVIAAIAAVGLWQSRERLRIAPFVLTALYALLCPVFGDYHLLTFLAPLLLVCLEESPATANRGAQVIIAATSLLMLAPKNYIYFSEFASWKSQLSLQTIVNPLLLIWAVILLFRQTAAEPEPRAAAEL